MDLIFLICNYTKFIESRDKKTPDKTAIINACNITPDDTTLTPSVVLPFDNLNKTFCKKQSLFISIYTININIIALNGIVCPILTKTDPNESDFLPETFLVVLLLDSIKSSKSSLEFILFLVFYIIL